ncbi:MAG: hypothetical protein AB7I25_10700 [Vicinamibacterales bacterium]
MANTEPFVQAALIAENVLMEQDGVASAIRIADTFTIDDMPDGMPANIKPAFALNVLLMLKSGDVSGESEIELVMRSPNGEAKSLGAKSVVLQGGISGANVKMSLSVLGLVYGDPYWLDVLWGPERKRLTSIPFRFKRSEPPTEGQPKK